MLASEGISCCHVPVSVRPSVTSRCAALSPWCSMSHGFVSDSWYLFH